MEKKRGGRERKKNKKKGFSLKFSLTEREGVRSLQAKADTSQVEARTALWFCEMIEARGEGPEKNMINYSGLQDSDKNVNATLSPIFAPAE